MGFSEGMADCNVAQIRSERVGPHDFLILTLRDHVDSSNLESILSGVQVACEDCEISMIVLRESEFSDLSKLTLHQLIALQERVENAIVDMSVRDQVDEA